MLKQEINEKIKNIPLQVLIKKSNYNSKQKIKKSLDKFIDCESIYLWLNSGFYDLVYNAEKFFIILCNILEIDKKKISQELAKYKELKTEIERFKSAFIFVNTDFKRKNEPIFSLAACENKRRIFLYEDKRYLFNSLPEILKKVSNEIAKHYITHCDKSSIWGKIKNYQLYLFDKVYTFDTKGNILDTNVNFDTNFASLKFKNKIII